MLRQAALCALLLPLFTPASVAGVLRLDGAPAQVASGHPVSDVAVGDFDGDGFQDAVAMVETGLVFFRGRGDGSLSPGIGLSDTPKDLGLAIGFDGHAELIAAYIGSNTVRLLRGTSSGLVVEASYNQGLSTAALGTGDLNGDGIPDLVISGGTAVSVRMGTPDGHFGAERILFNVPGGRVALADLNHDGHLDVVCEGWFPGGFMTVLLGDGAGGFLKLSTSSPSGNPGPLVAADLTGDGNVDLAFRTGPTGTVLTILPGVGNGRFGAAVNTPIPVSASRMIARDLNGDGRIDLLAAGAPGIVTLLGNGTGGFAVGGTATLASNVAGIGLADLDGDGIVDLVAGSGNDVVTMRGLSDGTFVNNWRPVVRCRDVVVPGGKGCVADASIDDGTYDPDGDAFTLSQSPPGPYPLGVTHVTLSSTDSRGAAATCTASVTVVDTTAPSLDVEVTPRALWPANHRLVAIHASVASHDACDDSPAITLASIACSEPGAAPDDIQGAEIGTADFDFQLRAERKGNGPGRTYTICYESRDDAGNATRRCIEVEVGHDHRAQVATVRPTTVEGEPEARSLEAIVAGSPSRGEARLRYALPGDGHVRVSIYDVAGHLVARPIDGLQGAGWHWATFEGGGVSQLYFYRVEWEGRAISGRIPYLR